MGTPAKKRGFIKYKSYSFVEKDPVIDVLRTARTDAEMTIIEVAEASGVSPSTLVNWWNGNTKRPQFATCAAAAVAMGLDSIPITAEARKKFKA